MFKEFYRDRPYTIIFVALAMKLTLLFVVAPLAMNAYAGVYHAESFTDLYDYLAGNIASGNGYRFFPDTAETTLRSPGYPLLLAAIFLFFGKSMIAVKIVNVIMTVLTAYIVGLLVHRLSSHRGAAIAAALIFAFHPAVLVAESRAGVETLATLVTALFVLLLYAALKSGRPGSYFLAGAVLGFDILVKGTPLLFPVVLAMYLLFYARTSARLKSVSINLAAMVVAISLVLSPWIIRNYQLTGKFIPTMSVLGVSAGHGLYVCKNLSLSKGTGSLVGEAAGLQRKAAEQQGLQFRNKFYQFFYSANDEVEFSRYLLKQVVEEYKESPTLLIKCVSKNIFNFWFAGRNTQATVLNMIVQLPYLVMALMGVFISIRRQQAAISIPIVLFICYYVAVHLPILAVVRYTVPLIPLLAILITIPYWPREANRKLSLSTAANPYKPSS